MLSRIEDVLKFNIIGAEKAVLLALAIRADDRGQCFPAVSTLATDAGISKRTAYRAISALKRIGVLSVQKQKNRKANLYTLKRDCISRGVTMSPPLCHHATPRVSPCHPDGDTTSPRSNIESTKKVHKEMAYPSDTQKTAVILPFPSQEGRGDSEGSVPTPNTPPMILEERSMDVDEVLASVKETREQYQPKTAVARLEKVWRDALADSNPERYVRPLSTKQKGQLKHFLADTGMGLSSKVIRSVVLHWDDFVVYAKNSLAVYAVPEYPNVGFILANLDGVVNFVLDKGKDAPSPATAPRKAQGTLVSPPKKFAEQEEDQAVDYLAYAKKKLYGHGK